MDRGSWALLGRLTTWLAAFRRCFGHRAQHVSLQAYVEGLLSDSPRKSMQAMLARVTAPQSYQAFQHFITDAPWDAGAIWRCLLAQLPDRHGLLILDDTCFLKQGAHSVGVARQYAGTLKTVANCQVAVTAALWAHGRAWFVGAELYLPEAWLTAAARAQARIPATRGFLPKWRLALGLVRRLRVAGIAPDVVLADAGYGDVVAFRTALDRGHLHYVVGISRDITALPGPGRLELPPRRPGAGRPPHRRRLVGAAPAATVAALIARLPAAQWRRGHWGHGQTTECAAIRVTLTAEARGGGLPPPRWLLAERARGASTPHRYYVSNLPADTPLTRLARLAHQRWAIEQQYQDLKTELGIDHFEGRTYPGWHHHVVLSAVAHTFLQRERRRARRAPALTFPQVRAITQEIFTGLLFITRDRYWNWLQHGRRYLPLRN